MPHSPQLSLLNLPPRTPGVWDRVDAAHRTLVIEALAQLIAKAVAAARAEEAGNE